MNSSVAEFIREEVPDWDDEVVAMARFKAFSGQRSDWEPRFFFWRDLILKVARHLGVFTIQASEMIQGPAFPVGGDLTSGSTLFDTYSVFLSELKRKTANLMVRSNWFSRGGLTPLCIDHVLLEMYNNGDILRSVDLMNSSGGRLYQMFKRVGHLIGISRSSTPQEIFEDRLILRTLLQERATEVTKVLSESHWTSSCVITMEKFQSTCRGSDEASIIMSYLSGCGKARYLSIRRMNLIEGVKISLAPTPLSNISSIDYDTLHLNWTAEKLHQQLDVIDRRCEKIVIISDARSNLMNLFIGSLREGSDLGIEEVGVHPIVQCMKSFIEEVGHTYIFSFLRRLRKSALQSLKSKNKEAALRHVRLLKLTSETREKCTALLNRVEEVLSIIENAESTKQVSEAIQIGARAIKDNSISIEELHAHLQELDESVASQKQVEEALESMPLQHTDIEDEDVEEEFKKLEMELGDEIPHVQIAETVVDGSTRKVMIQESVAELNETISNLKLEAA